MTGETCQASSTTDFVIIINTSDATSSTGHSRWEHERLIIEEIYNLKQAMNNANREASIFGMNNKPVKDAPAKNLFPTRVKRPAKPYARNNIGVRRSCMYDLKQPALDR